MLKAELSRSVGAQHPPGEEWRINSRKSEGIEPKGDQCPAVDVIGDVCKIQCCKEKYCIGTWNISYMNQGKLEVFKQVMSRVNIDILAISELKWTKLLGCILVPCYIYPD